jgi:hypothetical protein
MANLLFHSYLKLHDCRENFSTKDISPPFIFIVSQQQKNHQIIGGGLVYFINEFHPFILRTTENFVREFTNNYCMILKEVKSNYSNKELKQLNIRTLVVQPDKKCYLTEGVKTAVLQRL